jgi:hypothetical protein
MSNYEVNVLVNGNRCKQFNHNGKLFIEAKKGSEYSIEIKNNTWQRILAVASVDGLDVLNGKTAREDANGYVINGYGTLKIDGFRVSNEKVAKFLFDYKGGSYAASKEDGSEKNVGVVGVRIFQELVKPTPPPPVVIREEHHHHHHDHWCRPWWDRPYYGDTTIWCGGLTASGDPTYGSSTLDCCDFERSSTETYSCDNVPTKGAPSSPKRGLMGGGMKSSAGNYSKGIKSRMSNAGGASASSGDVLRAMNFCSNPQAANAEPLGFDMGTKWGEAKESKVIEVEFEKGVMALTANIYYASRQSLIEMGVPLGNEKQVSFPEPFEDGKYAKPPTGWNG